jgi:V8-like Glu-specific endopeptidase
VLFQAERRTGRYQARDDAGSAPAGGGPAPAPADGGPAPAPADGGPAVTRIVATWSRLLTRPPAWAALIITLAGAVGVTVTPAHHGSYDIARGFLLGGTNLVSGSPNAQDFAGTPAVGALFTLSGDTLGAHFCTASVVNSPNEDLVMTAAHCVSGTSATIAFVPGYDAGATPYGVWTVTRVYVDAAWSSSSDPDDDVAFLRVSQAGSTVPIQEVTGAEQLEIGTPAQQLVEVIGYPDSSNEAITCRNWTSEPMQDQLEFDCGGYTDGTSGGPFLTSVNPLNGRGTVIGVIGGYEQGGYYPEVSYSAMFGANVMALYEAAVAGG